MQHSTQVFRNFQGICAKANSLFKQQFWVVTQHDLMLASSASERSIEEGTRRAGEFQGTAAHSNQSTFAAGYPPMFKSAIDIDQPVLIFSKKLKLIGEVIGWFRAQGFSLTLQELFEREKLVSPAVLAEHSLIVVDLDSFGGIDACFDALIWIRENIVSVPVVVLSHDFLVDDFSCERLALTDVSLRLPVSFPSLELSLAIAQHNNLSWQLRSTEMSERLSYVTQRVDNAEQGCN